MATTSTYLNFTNQTEEAFNYYKGIFGTEFVGPIMRLGDIPASEGMPPVSEEDKNLVMNMQLPILGGHMLMGNDVPEFFGPLTVGNNVSICLDPDTRAEADTLFAALSAGGKVDMPLAEAFWGDYFGSLTDKYGIQWLINCTSKG